MRILLLLLWFTALHANGFSDKLLVEVRRSVKEDLSSLLDPLESNLFVVETGPDDLRIKYVNAQGAIEHALACAQATGDITDLVGIIHTPMPATPLCVEPDGPVEDILDASIRNNPSKLYTVRSRAQILREYLMKGGRLYSVYSKNGLEKRTPEQQAVYRKECKRFPHNLVDVQVDATIEPDMIGATYLFLDKNGTSYAFSIKSRQVSDIQPEAEWGLWFGPIEGVVQERVDSVLDYVAHIGGPDLRKCL